MDEILVWERISRIKDIYKKIEILLIENGNKVKK